MAERSVTVGSKVGLHARPAMLFTQAVAASGAKVTISRPGAAGVDASMHLVRDGHGCGPRRGGRPRERQRSRSRPTRRDARDRPRRKVGRDRVAESAGRTAGDGRRGPARPLRDGVAGPHDESETSTFARDCTGPLASPKWSRSSRRCWWASCRSRSTVRVEQHIASAICELVRGAPENPYIICTRWRSFTGSIPTNRSMGTVAASLARGPPSATSTPPWSGSGSGVLGRNANARSTRA